MILKALANSRFSMIKLSILFPNTALSKPPILAKTGQFILAKYVCISVSLVLSPISTSSLPFF